MIPKQYRLLLKSDSPFKGRKIYGKWTVLVVGAEDNLQWAVRVSKKIDSRATHRNRLRRQISQWLYRERGSLVGKSFLVILRQNPSVAELENVFLELRQFLFIK